MPSSRPHPPSLSHCPRFNPATLSSHPHCPRFNPATLSSHPHCPHFNPATLFSSLQPGHPLFGALASTGHTLLIALTQFNPATLFSVSALATVPHNLTHSSLSLYPRFNSTHPPSLSLPSVYVSGCVVTESVCVVKENLCVCVVKENRTQMQACVAGVLIIMPEQLGQTE